MIFDPESLLYIYIAVSFAMIAFNLVCIGGRKGAKALIDSRAAMFKRRIRGICGAMPEYGVVPTPHLRFLKRRLRNVSWLTAFSRAAEALLETRLYDRYFSQLSEVFSSIVPAYRNKNSTVRAYFSHVLSRFDYAQFRDNDFLISYLLDCVTGGSIYLRENSLTVLYRYGAAWAVSAAIEKMDRNGIPHHTKLISDGLLTFKGSHRKLAGLLMERFAALSPGYQVAVINYASVACPEFPNEILRAATEPGRNKEVAIAALRYFRRNRYEGAVDALIGFLERDTLNDWEYASVAAGALGSYPSEDVKRALMRAVTSRQWHVRQNAVRSLLRMDLTDAEKTALWQTDDRYARETLAYVSREPRVG